LPELILASGSPRRKELLESAGYSFVAVPTNVEELTWTEEPPRALAEMNARRKALAGAELHPDRLVLGADTIVVLDGEVFGKPGDLEEARTMLLRLAGRVHQVITAVSLLHAASNRECTFCDFTQVKFRDFDTAHVDVYFRRVDPLDKAGAYAAQDDEGHLIDRIEGSLTNVIGLPMERLARTLELHFPDSAE